MSGPIFGHGAALDSLTVERLWAAAAVVVAHLERRAGATASQALLDAYECGLLGDRLDITAEDREVTLLGAAVAFGHYRREAAKAFECWAVDDLRAAIGIQHGDQPQRTRRSLVGECTLRFARAATARAYLEQHP